MSSSFTDNSIFSVEYQFARLIDAQCRFQWSAASSPIKNRIAVLLLLNALRFYLLFSYSSALAQSGNAYGGRFFAPMDPRVISAAETESV
jgi:hypothetical protein